MARTILVATDFSAAADEALDAALGQATRAGAAVELLHVYEPKRAVIEAIGPTAGELSLDEGRQTLAARAHRATRRIHLTAHPTPVC
jgi:nucleotide-binding universal stress UspA family protein